MRRCAGLLSMAAVAAAFTVVAPVGRAQEHALSAVDLEANGGPRAGVPYTANRKTTHVQQLADGTIITHVTTGREARDSEGRTYGERRMMPPGETDESKATFAYHINDSVAHTSTSWTSRSKVATVFHMDRPMAPRNTDAPVRMPEGSVQMVETKMREMEKLGTRTIGGVEAEGTRTTRVIPAGEQGNDQPLTITRERWYSEQLKLTVMMINTDPRTGTTTMELSGIEPGEPDEALFKVPEGYEIRERTMGQME